jgi:hypothetical protein
MLKVQCRVLKITHDVDHPRSEKCSQSREDIR